MSSLFDQPVTRGQTCAVQFEACKAIFAWPGFVDPVVFDADQHKAVKVVFESMYPLQCNPFTIAGFEAGYRVDDRPAAWADRPAVNRIRAGQKML